VNTLYTGPIAQLPGAVDLSLAAGIAVTVAVCAAYAQRPERGRRAAAA
jgi:hypothetical protein